MKLYKSFYIIIGCVAAFCCSCKEESLTAEVPEIENALMMGKPQFVLPGAENNITHRLSGEEMVFELRQGKNSNQDIVAEFETSDEVLADLTKKYADFKGIGLYKLLDKSQYTLPASVVLEKGQSSVSVPVKIHHTDNGTYVLPLVLKEGSSMFGIQKAIGTWGELVLGPLLLVIGLFMLFGDKLNLPKFGFNGNAEGLARKGGWGALLIGVLFALAFCPTSGVFYFGMLIPMSATATAGYLLPVVFAIATAIPVLAVAWILAFSVQQMGNFYGRMQKVQKWMNLIVGVVFILVGIYYCWIMYL